MLHHTNVPKRTPSPPYIPAYTGGFSLVGGLTESCGNAASHTLQKEQFKLHSSFPQSVPSYSHVPPISYPSISPLNLFPVPVHSSLISIVPSVPSFDSMSAPDTSLIPSNFNSLILYSPKGAQSAPPVSTYAMITEEIDTPSLPEGAHPASESEVTTIHLKTGKKYKPVALKTRPVLG